MSLRFDQPLFLLGLLLMLPIGAAALASFAAMTRTRRWSAIILRTLLMCSLLGMLAGASLVRRSDKLAVIACIDASGSVRQFFHPAPAADGTERSLSRAAREFLDRSSKSRRPDDLAGVIVFGASPSATGVLEPRPFAIPETLDAPADGTSIDQALRLARAMIPPDAAGRIVLFSDGVQTSGDALAAARTSSSAKPIPIDIVPLTYTVDHEVVLESIDTPPTAQAGSTIPIRVVLTATKPATGTLSILHEGAPLDINPTPPTPSQLRLELKPGPNVELFHVPLPDGRIHRFEAIWTPDPGPAGADTIAANNRAESVTVSPGRAGVLIVDGVSGGDPAGPGATLGHALARAGLQVQSIGPDALQPDLLFLQQFDLIILQNVAAEAILRSAHSALAACINQLGIGLIMLGGPDSFGPGGWKGSVLEPLLPVKLDLPERVVTPAAAVVIVIDNSGSMNRPVLGSGRSQQDIADEGAALAIESMDKSDLVGVITFNSDYTVDVPLAPNKDAKATAKLVRSIGADGGTNMPPALAEAHRQLAAARADVKHCIVLSDGVSQGKEQLPDMADRMAADGIMVTTIAIGNDADASGMAEMAKRGKGQFYRVIDPNVLPRVLIKAVRIVRSPLVREGAFTPIVPPSGSPVLDGVASAMGDSTLAPLGGLVLTQARTDPGVINVLIAPKPTKGDGGGEPVLAYWSAGLGRVAAFTSDAHPRWAAPWLDASAGAGFARFWTQLARTIARAPGSPRTQELRADLDGDKLTVRLRASSDEGKAIDGLTIPATLYDPTGATSEFRLAQVAPGEYETQHDLSPSSASGSYVIILSPSQTTRGRAELLPPVIGGITRPGAASAEYRSLRSNESLMQQLARETGGDVLSLDATADLFSHTGRQPAEGRTPLWPMLAIASVVLMLLDTATRRIAWDRLLSREMGAEVAQNISAAMRDRSSQAAATLGQLRRESPQPSATVPGPGPLTDEDADALRDRERTRRRARPAAPTQPPIIEAPTSPQDSETGLRAAKRRAQRRMDED